MKANFIGAQAELLQAIRKLQHFSLDYSAIFLTVFRIYSPKSLKALFSSDVNFTTNFPIILIAALSALLFRYLPAGGLSTLNIITIYGYVTSGNRQYSTTR
jgi:hypothetical protein